MKTCFFCSRAPADPDQMVPIAGHLHLAKAYLVITIYKYIPKVLQQYDIAAKLWVCIYSK